MNLEISKTVEDHSTVLTLKGEVDVYTAPKLKEELYSLLRISNHKVIIDLSEVEYMDSTGLGVFIGGLKASKLHQSHLTLRNVTQRLDRLFSITGFAEVVAISRGGEN